MKRMFVYERFRGKGIGRALVEAVLREARAAGYDLPEDLRRWLVFMELPLRESR